MGDREPTHAWRASLSRRGLPDGRSQGEEVFVVDRGPSEEKVISGLVAELYEEPWRDPHDYLLIDTHGNVKEKFTVTTWSIEEELGVSAFAIFNGALRNLSVSVFYSEPPRVNRVEKLVVDCLQAVAADDHKTLSFLSDALARDQRLLAEERKRQDRLADARIAAISGAGDEYAAGDEFRRAQELLRSRFRAYNVEIDGAMLGALMRFGILHRSIGTSGGPGKAALAVFSAALDSFVIACRLVAFDRSLERKVAAPPLEENLGAFAALPAEMQAELRELEKTLGALEYDLLQDAEWKDWSDARLNAIQMRAAATHVARAREHLENGSRQEFESAKNVAARIGLVTEPKPADTPIPTEPRTMISIPRTRITIGLTPGEADRLALQLAKMEEALHEPGIGAFEVFDVDAAARRRRVWLEASMPAHEVEVGPFEIDVYPVTNAQWSSYMKTTGAGKPEKWPLKDGKHFVSGLSWREAEMYAKHHDLALPTEGEWECAARRDRRFFTWGDDYFPQGEVAFHPPVDEPYAVGSRREIASSRGVQDLLGQFGEYCADSFEPYPGADRAIWNQLFPNSQGQRVVRGGYDLNQDATCVSRRGVPETERRTHLKFRCVRRTS